jgi:hypothetical protein
MTEVIANRGGHAAGSPTRGGRQSCRQRGRHADHPDLCPHHATFHIRVFTPNGDSVRDHRSQRT